MTLVYRSVGHERLVIHQEDDEGDWLWVDPPESAPTFAGTEALKAYSTRVGLSVSGTYPGRYDFDVVEAWLANPDAMTIDHVNRPEFCGGSAAWNHAASAAVRC